jgi:hypothetical protein
LAKNFRHRALLLPVRFLLERFVFEAGALGAGQQSLALCRRKNQTNWGCSRPARTNSTHSSLRLGAAKNQENKIYSFLSKVLNIGSNVQITSFLTRDLAQPVVLNGTAPSTDAVLQFSKRLRNAEITEVQMPLSSLTAAPNGRTSFVMSFRILSLNFE